MSPQYSAKKSRNRVNLPVEDLDHRAETDFIHVERLSRTFCKQKWRVSTRLHGLSVKTESSKEILFPQRIFVKWCSICSLTKS